MTGESFGFVVRNVATYFVDLNESVCSVSFLGCVAWHDIRKLYIGVFHATDFAFHRLLWVHLVHPLRHGLERREHGGVILRMVLVFKTF